MVVESGVIRLRRSAARTRRDTVLQDTCGTRLKQWTTGQWTVIAQAFCSEQ